MTVPAAAACTTSGVMPPMGRRNSASMPSGRKAIVTAKAFSRFRPAAISHIVNITRPVGNISTRLSTSRSCTRHP